LVRRHLQLLEGGAVSEGRDYRHLAVGFVEVTTQYDYAEVPEHVQNLLSRAADALGRWIETQGVYRIEPHQDHTALSE
jgi:hypothetical protein